MLLAVAAACGSETVEVPGETVVVEKVVTETVEVPGETVVKEVVKEVMVPGETVVVKEEVVKEVMVPGETVVIEKVVTETVEVPGETVTVEVVKEVQVPGETVVVEKVVTETVEVPGETVVVEKVVTQTVEVPGQTVVVEKEVVKTVEVPGQTVVVEKEVVKTVAGPERVVVKEVRGKKYVTDPTTGKPVSAPEHGGTFVFATVGGIPHTDTFLSHDPGVIVSGVVEKLSHGDWAVDRNVYAWRSQYLPWNVMKPFLAESWEQPDDTTIIINVRQGVQWHDKPPMNGRELTAEDIEYNYHRYLGMGSGFTEDPGWSFEGFAPYFESITATDKYTVVVKLGEPQLDALEKFVTGALAVPFMYPPEVIEQYGDAKEWKNLVGTGPFELVDWVPGSSFTYVKNPNYWGYDEKYPENRLPYVDEMRVLVMPDAATRLAAMRSRKVDALGLPFGWTQINSIDQVVSLKRTNPEFQFEPMYAFSSTSFTVNTQVPPFDDVRVRHALQMAINLDEINKVFWQGYADNTPHTLLGSTMLGYVVPYEDWPEETKQYYMYDPARAEALLDAVGLKRGADGFRFSTTLMMNPENAQGPTLDHSYVVEEYWEAIGIDVEVESIDMDIWRELVYNTKEWEGIAPWVSGVGSTPLTLLAILSVNYFGGFSPPNWNDPVYDAMYEAILAATTVEEQLKASREALLYIAEQHVTIWGGMSPAYGVTQPWVVGFSGEVQMSYMDSTPFKARLWIDSELKEAMGY